MLCQMEYSIFQTEYSIKYLLLAENIYKLYVYLPTNTIHYIEIYTYMCIYVHLYMCVCMYV